MASVNNTRRDDSTQRLQGEYKKNLAQLEKRHKQEIRNLVGTHEQELVKVQQEHGQRLESVKEKSGQILSAREQKFQREMGELRRLHAQQTKSVSEQNLEEKLRLAASHRDELESLRGITDRQKEILRNSNEEFKAKKEQEFLEAADIAKVSQKEGLTEQREKLVKAHEKEREILRKTYFDQLDQLRRSGAEVRKVKGQEIDRLKERMLNQHAHLSETYMRNTVREREKARKISEAQQQTMIEGVHHERDKFSELGQELRAHSDLQWKEIRESVAEKMNDKLNSLKDKIQDLEAESVASDLTNKQRLKHEKQVVLDEYARVLRDFAKERKGLVDAANSHASQRIEKLTEDHQQELAATNRHYLDKIHTEKKKHLEHIEDRVALLKNEKQHVEGQASKRVEKIKSMTDHEVTSLRDHFEQNLSEMKNAYKSKLEGLRDIHQKDRRDRDKNFQKFFTDIEKNNQARLETAQASHQKQLDANNETHQKEIRRMKTQFDWQLKGLDKSRQIERQNIEQQLSSRVQQLHDQHQKDMERVQRRHQEELQRLALQGAKKS